jgi:hypothetical protein
VGSNTSSSGDLWQVTSAPNMENTEGDRLFTIDDILPVGVYHGSLEWSGGTVVTKRVGNRSVSLVSGGVEMKGLVQSVIEEASSVAFSTRK